MENESDFGNIEYKRTISNITKEKMISYASQMKYRILQGNHIAYYYIGINDDGSVHGLTDLIAKTIEDFNDIVKIAECYVLKIKISTDDTTNKQYIKFTITDVKYIPEHRILITGEKNMGKQTFINNCLFGLNNNVTQHKNNRINYFPFGIKIYDEHKYINNFNNCENIIDIKKNSDYLIYFINIENTYKICPHNYQIFDQLFILHFIKNVDDVKHTSNCINMLQNDMATEIIYDEDTNICMYNNSMEFSKIEKFLLNLIKGQIKQLDANVNCEMDHLIVLDVLYNFSTNKFLLLILSKVNNKNNCILNVKNSDNIIGHISSIHLDSVECEYITEYNHSYTIIIEFERNIQKLIGRNLCFIY